MRGAGWNERKLWLRGMLQLGNSRHGAPWLKPSLLPLCPSVGGPRVLTWSHKQDGSEPHLLPGMYAKTCGGGVPKKEASSILMCLCQTFEAL